MFCQPYTPPNLSAIIPSVVLGAAVLSLALLAAALYWRHLHRLSAAAHAKMRGPPGERPAVRAHAALRLLFTAAPGMLLRARRHCPAQP